MGLITVQIYLSDVNGTNMLKPETRKFKVEDDWSGRNVLPPALPRFV